MKGSLLVLGSVLALLLLFFTDVEAGFSNGGRMQSKNLHLSVKGTLDNNGELIGTESATIACDTLTGKGLISSPLMAITTNIFAYTGTINCSGKCVIMTTTPFDERMFKRTGGGEFTILLIGNEPKPASERCAMYDFELSDGLLIQAE